MGSSAAQKTVGAVLSFATPSPPLAGWMSGQFGDGHGEQARLNLTLLHPPEGTLGYVTCALAATAQSAERKWARQWPIRP